MTEKRELVRLIGIPPVKEYWETTFQQAFPGLTAKTKKLGVQLPKEAVEFLGKPPVISGKSKTLYSVRKALEKQRFRRWCAVNLMYEGTAWAWRQIILCAREHEIEVVPLVSEHYEHAVMKALGSPQQEWLPRTFNPRKYISDRVRSAGEKQMAARIAARNIDLVILYGNSVYGVRAHLRRTKVPNKVVHYMKDFVPGIKWPLKDPLTRERFKKESLRRRQRRILNRKVKPL